MRKFLGMVTLVSGGILIGSLITLYDIWHHHPAAFAETSFPWYTQAIYGVALFACSFILYFIACVVDAIVQNRKSK